MMDVSGSISSLKFEPMFSSVKGFRPCDWSCLVMQYHRE